MNQHFRQNAHTRTSSRRKQNMQTEADTNALAYGKVPPQTRELEVSVLGVCMLEPDTFDLVAAIISPAAFYVDAHQRIFCAMASLAARSQPIDMLTVVEELKAKEELDIIGGPYYVTKLTNDVKSSANVESWARIIHEHFLKREVIRISGNAVNEAYENSSDAFDLLNKVSNDVNQLATEGIRDGSKDMVMLGIQRMKHLEEMRHRKENMVIGVPTGFKNLDKITRGWIPTYLIILAARPSVGKTALALNLARNAAADPVKPTPVLFLCLEMNSENLYDRILSAESGVSFEKIIDARLSDEEMDLVFQNGARPLSNIPLTIEYCPTLNIIEARAKVRRWLKKVGGFGLVIIDYLQLMTGVRDDLNSQNREQEISNISRSLKSLAGEMKVPIIALSQMSRDIEKRGGKAKLSDLRESGALEQDADVVAFLSRADYEMAEHEVNAREKGKALITFKKNRQGKLDVIPMRTALDIQRWFTPEQYEGYEKALDAEKF